MNSMFSQTAACVMVSSVLLAAACAPSSGGSVPNGGGGASAGGAVGSSGGGNPTLSGGASGGPTTGGAVGTMGGMPGGTGPGGRSPGGAGGAAAAPSSGGAAGTGIAGAPGGASGSVAGGTGPAGGGFGYAGPSRCATAGVALCENFENGLSATLWATTRSGDASIVVDSTHAARGSNALHVKTTAGNGFAYIKQMKSFPATGNLVYGRMFLWFDDDITTSGHFSLAEGAGPGGAGLSRFGGQFKEFGVGSDGGPSGDWTDHDDKVIPSKTWTCAEFELKGDTNEFRVWWDDVERPALRSGAPRHAGFTMPQFNSLWFGWWMYNLVEPQDVWIDEIAVDFKPIGCAK